MVGGMGTETACDDGRALKRAGSSTSECYAVLSAMVPGCLDVWVLWCLCGCLGSRASECMAVQLRSTNGPEVNHMFDTHQRGHFFFDV